MTLEPDHDLSHAAKRVVEAAQRAGLRIATVESCTAGAVAMCLSDVPGAGDVLDGGMVVYSKEAKIETAGVAAEFLCRHTAVSPETAVAMVEGALQRLPAEVVVGVTGCLGPKPDDDGNPAGLVYVAAARRGGLAPRVLCLNLQGGKGAVRRDAVLAALGLLALVLADRGH